MFIRWVSSLYLFEIIHHAKCVLLTSIIESYKFPINDKHPYYGFNSCGKFQTFSLSKCYEIKKAL